MDIMWILLIGVIAIASFGQGRKNWSHNALAKNRQVWPIYRTDDQTLNAGLSFLDLSENMDANCTNNIQQPICVPLEKSMGCATKLKLL